MIELFGFPIAGTTKDSDGTYQAVPFSYGNTANAVDSKNSDSGLTNSCYRPPFLIPERLQCNLVNKMNGFNFIVNFLLAYDKDECFL